LRIALDSQIEQLIRNPHSAFRSVVF